MSRLSICVIFSLYLYFDVIQVVCDYDIVIDVQCSMFNAQCSMSTNVHGNEFQCSMFTLKRNGKSFNVENIEIAPINVSNIEKPLFYYPQ